VGTDPLNTSHPTPEDWKRITDTVASWAPADEPLSDSHLTDADCAVSDAADRTESAHARGRATWKLPCPCRICVAVRARRKAQR
jgi:hypothetical protein